MNKITKSLEVAAVCLAVFGGCAQSARAAEWPGGYWSTTKVDCSDGVGLQRFTYFGLVEVSGEKTIILDGPENHCRVYPEQAVGQGDSAFLGATCFRDGVELLTAKTGGSRTTIRFQWNPDKDILKINGRAYQRCMTPQQERDLDRRAKDIVRAIAQNKVILRAIELNRNSEPNERFESTSSAERVAGVDQDATGRFGFAVAVIGFLIYFLPSIIAWCQSHRDFVAIFVLNFFFGWSILGWIGALIWLLVRARVAPVVRCERAEPC